MRRTLITAAAILMTAACGGISSYEDAMEAQAAIVADLVDVLQGVDDEASAKEAASEIEALAERLAEVSRQMQELPKPSMQQMQVYALEQNQRLADVQEKAAEHMAKIGQYPALMEAWTNAMARMR